MKILERLIKIGLYIWIFLLPWQTRWLAMPRFVKNEFWEYGSVSLYATEILALLILVLFFIFIIGQRDWLKILAFFKNKNNYKQINLFSVCILLLSWVIISNFWAGDHLIVWTRLTHIILAMFMLGVMTYLSISWQKVLTILISAGVLQGYMAINQFLGQAVHGSTWLGISEQLPLTYGVSVIQYETLRWLRAYGSLPHPNILGSVMTISLLALVLFLLKIQKGDIAFIKFNPKLFTVAWYGSLFFIFSGLLLSFSRATWLATIVGLCIFFVIIYKYHRRLLAYFLKINLVLVLIILFWFAVTPLPFITRLQGEQPLEKQSYEERIKSYSDSKEVSEAYWLQGSGLGNYTSVLIHNNPQAKMSLNQPLHNSWLLVFNELGVIGFILFIVLFYFVFITSRARLVALAFLLPITVLMLFDHFWISLIFGNYLLLFIFYFVRRLQF